MQSEGDGGNVTKRFDSNSQVICINTGASCGVDGNIDNFIHLEKLENVELKGIASGLQVEGIGTASSGTS